MIARLRRNCLMLWLALAAMLGHGLLPQGFMLGRDAAAPDRYGLIFCSGGEAQAVRGSGHGLPDGGATIELGQACAFAMAAMAALPPPLAAALDVPARTLPTPPPTPLDRPATPYRRPHATGPPALA